MKLSFELLFCALLARSLHPSAQHRHCGLVEGPTKCLYIPGHGLSPCLNGEAGYFYTSLEMRTLRL